MHSFDVDVAAFKKILNIKERDFCGNQSDCCCWLCGTWLKNCALLYLFIIIKTNGSGNGNDSKNQPKKSVFTSFSENIFFFLNINFPNTLVSLLLYESFVTLVHSRSPIYHMYRSMMCFCVLSQFSFSAFFH